MGRKADAGTGRRETEDVEELKRVAREVVKRVGRDKLVRHVRESRWDR